MIVLSNGGAPKEQSRVTSGKDRQIVEEPYSRNPRDSDAFPGNLSRTLQAQQRIPQAKPGKVVGPVLQFESGSMIKEAYDPRTLVRSTIHPQHVNPPAYCYRGNGPGKQEKPTIETERVSSQARQLPQCGMVSKLAPDIAINIDGNPFYMTRAAVMKDDVNDHRVTIDTNLLPVKPQYNGIGVAAAAASRKVGTVQFGASRMN